jgi:hypothetical protein
VSYYPGIILLATLYMQHLFNSIYHACQQKLISLHLLASENTCIVVPGLYMEGSASRNGCVFSHVKFEGIINISPAHTSILEIPESRRISRDRSY